MLSSLRLLAPVQHSHSLSLSASMRCTHTHTHTHVFIKRMLQALSEDHERGGEVRKRASLMEPQDRVLFVSGGS